MNSRLGSAAPIPFLTIRRKREERRNCLTGSKPLTTWDPGSGDISRGDGMLVFRIRSNDAADSDQLKNRGAKPGCPVKPQRESPRWMASHRASGSSEGTRMLHDSSPISQIPPTSLATNGVPQARDSRKTFG